MMDDLLLHLIELTTAEYVHSDTYDNRLRPTAARSRC